MMHIITQIKAKYFGFAKSGMYDIRRELTLGKMRKSSIQNRKEG